MAQQQVMRHLHGGLPAPQTRREDARLVAQDRDHPRLIVRGNRNDAIAEPTPDLGRVFGEAQRRVAAHPAALFLQGLRQVPVVEGQVRRDAPLEQCVDQAVVEREPLLVPCPLAARLDARPGDRETVGMDPETRDQRDVLVDPVVVVAGAIAVAAVLDRAGPPAELVPDRVAPAVLVRGAFDLVGAGRDAPDELAREPCGQGACLSAHLTAPMVRPEITRREANSNTEMTRA